MERLASGEAVSCTVMMVVEKLWDVMEKHAGERREPNLV